MLTANCDSLKETVLRHLVERTAAEQSGDLCIITLPVRTVDGRLVDVFVEPRQKESFIVHDAGKAANELILNGINVTKAMHSHFSALAQHMGISWNDEMFQTTCKMNRLGFAALAVATCSAMATMDLLGQSFESGEVAICKQFGSALRIWGRGRAKITEGFSATGEWKQHSFDFVAYPKGGGSPIAINVLSPSGNPISAADRAAFRARDLQQTSFASWKKVSVETHSEEWTIPAKDLLAKCSDVVIEFGTNDKPTSSVIAEHLNAYLMAA